MEYRDIIIEVKTKWIKSANAFYRSIIEYTIDCNKDTPKEIAVKYINELTHTREIAREIKDNTITIVLLDKNRNEIKINKEDFEYIVNYTKYQWEA